MHACVRAYERMREEQHLRARQLLGIGPVRTFLRVVLFHAATVVQYMQTPQTPHGFAHIAAGVSTVHTALSCVWSDPINEFNNKTRQQRRKRPATSVPVRRAGPLPGTPRHARCRTRPCTATRTQREGTWRGGECCSVRVITRANASLLYPSWGSAVLPLNAAWCKWQVLIQCKLDFRSKPVCTARRASTCEMETRCSGRGTVLVL